jgi:putative Mg2+ transporter-C (MgtC) family protein
MVADYWTGAELATNGLILLNLLGALLLGLLVGYERSYHGRAAGMRTYGIVCMASAALTIIGGYPEFWFAGHGGAATVAADPTRIIQGRTSRTVMDSIIAFKSYC